MTELFVGIVQSLGNNILACSVENVIRKYVLFAPCLVKAKNSKILHCDNY